MTTSTESSTTDATIGLVESLTKTKAAGWVAGTPEEFPARIDLCLNDLIVATTRAENASERTSWNETRSFIFGIRDLWRFAKQSDEVSVRVNGKPMPINSVGPFLHPKDDGEFTIEDLRSKFAEGYVFNRAGWLNLSKKLDTEWQAAVISLYDQVQEIVQQNFGYDIFAFYGSLLGQVRERGFIGHDDDFDVAYLSNQTEGPKAADELRDLAYALIDAGLDVECHRTALHIHDPENSLLKIDLFHTYFDSDDNLALPFGRAGHDEYHRKEWQGTTTGKMADHEVLVPVDDEALVAHLYGENWKVPQGSFSWAQSRTKQDRSGFLSESYLQSVYWANFYARTVFTSGSTFFEKVNNRRDIPSTILDIGSGDGRDSFAFANAGKRAIGLDRSHIGVEHATKKAHSTGLADLLSFSTCDVTDDAGVREIVARTRQAAGGGAIAFYMRFFLHSIPEDVQDSLMATLASCAHKGDFIAAEFRTNKDEKKNKTYGKHYRRFQNGPKFGRSLHDQYGFTILEEEQGTGLSIYKDEDPHLYRVIARKGDTPGAMFHRNKQAARRLAGKVKRRLQRSWKNASN